MVSLSLVRYRTNDYSVPVAYEHRDALLRGYVDRVVINNVIYEWVVSRG